MISYEEGLVSIHPQSNIVLKFFTPYLFNFNMKTFHFHQLLKFTLLKVNYFSELVGLFNFVLIIHKKKRKS